ncbi:MAG: hypothetical protein PWQ55_253 [Chloroflexota bacterium]|nr:hypothetical protein [Chloroflexota bacterium]
MKKSSPFFSKRFLLAALVIVAAVGITLNWLHLTPGGCYSKGMAIGASVCHQLSTHSYIRADVQFPLCARCSGLYLGCFIGILYYLTRGKKAGVPARGYLVLLGVLTVAWAGDGINSFMSDILNRPFLYTTNNLTRLVTGFSMGLVLSTALVTLFNLTIWKAPLKQPLLHAPWQVGAYAALAGLTGALLVFAGKTVFLALAGVAILMVVVVITLLYTIFWVIVTRSENSFQQFAQLWLFMLAGFATAVLQITLMTSLRGLLLG